MVIEDMPALGGGVAVGRKVGSYSGDGRSVRLRKGAHNLLVLVVMPFIRERTTKRMCYSLIIEMSIDE